MMTLYLICSAGAAARSTQPPLKVGGTDEPVQERLLERGCLSLATEEILAFGLVADAVWVIIARQGIDRRVR